MSDHWATIWKTSLSLRAGLVGRLYCCCCCCFFCEGRGTDELNPCHNVNLFCSGAIRNIKKKHIGGIASLTFNDHDGIFRKIKNDLMGAGQPAGV